MTLTLEALESLADEITRDSDARRDELARMVAAYARILIAKGHAERPATIWTDEPGHWDNSYPPDQDYGKYDGPLSILVQDWEHGYRATSGGFYHDAEFYTEEPGYAIDAAGQWFRGEITGTGRWGRFAAYPGWCNVDCTIEWDPVDVSDVPTGVLVKAEEKLRAMAFPE